ncbi:MAG: four helix bundle protein [Bacteroidetes bacterium GWA2_31_9b]|nr:MAG: four helix bundle protein [Bacteroidetes bacterium GWA2_31_9b]
MQKDNPALDKSFEFAKNIVLLYKSIVSNHKEFTLSKQLLRAGTSIGANVSEANGAISEADFSNKISIAYKECLETKYWLRLLKETDYLTESIFNDLFNKADELAKILFSILKKTRIKEK